MLKLPVLTMPSSRLQPSERVYWKYRSASSTAWALMAFSALAQMSFVQAKRALATRDLAVAKRSMVGSREIMVVIVETDQDPCPDPTADRKRCRSNASGPSWAFQRWRMSLSKCRIVQIGPSPCASACANRSLGQAAQALGRTSTSSAAVHGQARVFGQQSDMGSGLKITRSRPVACGPSRSSFDHWRPQSPTRCTAGSSPKRSAKAMASAAPTKFTAASKLLTNLVRAPSPARTPTRNTCWLKAFKRFWLRCHTGIRTSHHQTHAAPSLARTGPPDMGASMQVHAMLAPTARLGLHCLRPQSGAQHHRWPGSTVLGQRHHHPTSTASV
jgi:hypothetical protein